MGALKDLGTDCVADVCPVTGYPRNRDGDLLNPIDLYDGAVVPHWDKVGTELVNLTNPYGLLHFVAGSQDEFYCFDYAQVNAGPRGLFLVLDATINSETGSFTQSAGYEVLPVNTEAERIAAVKAAYAMTDQAQEWAMDKDIKHTPRGWNQTPEYFARAVFCNLFPYATELISDQERRSGSRRLEKIMADVLKKTLDS